MLEITYHYTPNNIIEVIHNAVFSMYNPGATDVLKRCPEP